MGQSPPMPYPGNSLAAARRLAGRACRRVRDWWRGETTDTFFDVHDPDELNPLLAAHGVTPFPASAAVGDPGVRVARRVWELRADLRAAFPLGLTPAQRRAYADWLLGQGAKDFGLTPRAVVAYLVELAADPSHGLADSFLWQPDWQKAVPHGLTRFGWEELKRRLAAEYGIRGRWLKAAKRPECFDPWDEVRLLWQARPELRDNAADSAALDSNAGPLTDCFRRQSTVPRPGEDWLRRLAGEIASGLPARPGVNMLAHYRYPSGLQVEAVQLAGSLESAGFRVARRDVPVGYPCDCDDPADYADPELFDVTVMKTGAGRGLDPQYPAAGLHPRPGVYRIAGWSWELEWFPKEYAEQARLADEVWTPSEFCAAAVRKVMIDRPVLAMMPGVATPSAPALPREYFGLRPGRFLVVFLFDMGSAMERKNPLGLIRAFRLAFTPSDPADLVLKVSRGDARPDEFARLKDAADRAGVAVINRVMSREESFGLMAACDCYTSLHRAEGFGFTVAEALLLGKPVVATDYSATTEFLIADTGLPVRYRMVPVGPGQPPYPADAVWAEPDERHAAERLRWAFEHPEEAKALGARAKRYAEVVLSPEAAGRRMADRLRSILASRRGAP
jgi:glycosyltransferase involved in cell wall biosynthesis